MAHSRIGGDHDGVVYRVSVSFLAFLRLSLTFWNEANVLSQVYLRPDYGRYASPTRENYEILPRGHGYKPTVVRILVVRHFAHRALVVLRLFAYYKQSWKTSPDQGGSK